MLSWDDFRYVKAIAETRSLGGAAAELSVNHSTVFRRLAQIEKQLGSRLFERSRAGYALTPCGEEMVRLAERMGEDIVTFERQVTGHDLRPSGELRITTNDTALVYLMTQVFADFRRAYPEIVLDVVVSNQALNLSKRDADVAVRATDRPPEALLGRRAAGLAWAVVATAHRAPERGDRADAAGVEHVAGAHHRLAARDVRSLSADVLPGIGSREDPHRRFVGIGLFDHDDRIGARRHRRAGRDFRALSWPDCL